MHTLRVFRYLFRSGLLIAAICAWSGCAKQADPVEAGAGPEQNGVYAVLNQGATPEEAQAGNAGSLILPYDRKHTDPESDEPLTYVAIDPELFVPLILEGEPGAEKTEGGKLILSVTLKKEYVKALEELTRRQLNGRIAVILDGDIITIHKVRSVISGGRFQLTRCTDNACEVLKSKLME